MTKKQGSEHSIESMLNAGHFGKADKPTASVDPVQPTKIQITLDEIKTYDHNPRQADNPVFQEIKESIRKTIDPKSILHVTRRPGENQYMICAGGNTRLQAIQELWAETEDERFYRFDVIYQPWESEVRVLADHLIENDLRANLTFIDQALALRRLREELENERGEKLSLRKFENGLKGLGFAKSNALLSRMDYTIDILFPLIPNILRSGLGGNQIVRLRKLHKAYEDHWQDNARGEVDERFVAIFEDAMKSLDTTDGGFDFDTFQSLMNSRVSQALGLPGSHYVDFSIQTNLKGIRDDKFNFSPGVQGNQDVQLVLTPPHLRQRPLESKAISGSESVSTARDMPSRETPDLSPPSDLSLGQLTQGVALESEAVPVPDMDSSDIGNAGVGLERLRHRAYETAREIAVAIDSVLVHCVLPYDLGFGYLIDLPGKPIQLEEGAPWEDRVHTVTISMTWWLLLLLSEVPNLPLQYSKHLPEDYLLARRLHEDSDRVYGHVGPMRYMDLGKMLQNPVKFGPILASLFTLVQIGQRIRRLATDDPHIAISLWQPQ